MADPKERADGFAKLFAQSFINKNKVRSDLTCSSVNKSVMNLKCITQANMYSATKEWKPKMTNSPDQIPAFIVSHCVNVFVGPLPILFNIKSCKFSDQWKISRISFIFLEMSSAKISLI